MDLESDKKRKRSSFNPEGPYSDPTPFSSSFASHESEGNTAINARGLPQSSENNEERERMIQEHHARISRLNADLEEATRLRTEILSDFPETIKIDDVSEQEHYGNNRANVPSSSEYMLDFSKRTIEAHIKALHTYNEVKDIAQGLIGMIAEKRGVRVKDVMEEYGLDEKD
ncbi:MAG: hypothetical protein M1820_000029 [Bogoriella megaspora]|nr:MAG: hypothetical protein M1820_000029 [Bogoriella megaspora]